MGLYVKVSVENLGTEVLDTARFSFEALINATNSFIFFRSSFHKVVPEKEITRLNENIAHCH